jgi:hypothetical protein
MLGSLSIADLYIPQNLQKCHLLGDYYLRVHEGASVVKKRLHIETVRGESRDDLFAARKPMELLR